MRCRVSSWSTMCPGAEVDVAVPSSNRVSWLREVAVVVAVYGLYSTVRNLVGGGASASERAYGNAVGVIAAEEPLGILWERGVQDAFLDARWFVWFWNVWYGTTHFVVTILVLVWLFRRHPARYSARRNALVLTTGVALVVFVVYPLMPPRLLGDCGPYGACERFGLTDTLEEVGGLWSFESETMASLSNQYAAMPSLHTAWAVWCALVVRRHSRPVAGRLILAYPMATAFGTIVTGNHYLLDVLAGAVLAWAAVVVLDRCTPTGSMPVEVDSAAPGGWIAR